MDCLSDEIICDILSFLPIKESALTSVLSKRWRNLFAYTPNLQFDDDQEAGCAQSFIDFVDRVLGVSGDLPIRNISIKSRKSIDTGHVTRWMTQVVKRNVVTLDIDVRPHEEAILVPLELFTCNTLVKLKLARTFDALIPDHVSLPSLKTLSLVSIYFYNNRDCALGKLLSACPVLEEFTIHSPSWQNQKCCRTVSSTTLKKLTMLCINRTDYWNMTFDTPNLAYLEYSDLVPNDYPFVNLESLVEAKLDLFIGPNPTNLMKGLSNVNVLELSSGYTSKVFWYFREVVPVFSNLFRLSITSHSFLGWQALPILLEKAPNLHTLVIKGPLHFDKFKLVYGSSCPVKVLKITQYRGKTTELAQMMHFVKKLSHLELVKVRGYAVNDEEKFRITKDLQILPIISKCNVQIKFCEETKQCMEYQLFPPIK